MNPHTRPFPFFPMALLSLAVLAACSTTPPSNARLDDARNSVRLAQSDPQTQGLPGGELQQATDALAAAEAALARRDDTATVDHLAYLTQRKVALAQEAGSRRAAEAAVAQANTAREQLRLSARTQEADAAQRNAADAQRSAESAQRDARASQRTAQNAQLDAQTAQRDAQMAQRDAQTAQRDAALSQQQAGESERRAAALEAQLRELNAKKTDRGMVITIGDVLFDSGQAQLRSGGLQSMDRLAVFLKTYPQRTATIEGFTDSVGGDASNQALSQRRAQAVRAALVNQGVAGERLVAQGYGEAHPVAGNESAGGRQMNRRVEIVLSDDRGVIPPR